MNWEGLLRKQKWPEVKKGKGEVIPVLNYLSNKP
jgi:hypothetical protein